MSKEVKNKKVKWKKCLKSKTEVTYNEYKEQNTNVKNLVVQAKNETWKEFGEKMQHDKKEIQKLFKKY